MHNFKRSIFGKIKALNYSQLHVTRCLINLGSFCAIFCSFFRLILAFITFIINQLFTSVLALFPFHVSWIRTPDLCVIYSELISCCSFKRSLCKTNHRPLLLFSHCFCLRTQVEQVLEHWRHWLLTHVTRGCTLDQRNTCYRTREIHLKISKKYSLHPVNHLNWQSIDVTHLTHVSCGRLNQRNHERFFLYICNN